MRVSLHTGACGFGATDTVHCDCSQRFLEVLNRNIGSRQHRIVHQLGLDREPIQTIDTVGFDIAALQDRKRLILGEIAKFFSGNPPTAPCFQCSLGNAALRGTAFVSLVICIGRPALTLQDVGQYGVNIHNQSRKLVTSALTTALTSAPITAA